MNELLRPQRGSRLERSSKSVASQISVGTVGWLRSEVVSTRALDQVSPKHEQVNEVRDE